MYSTFVPFLAILGLLQRASASCAQSCTLDTVVPAKELIWCPCYDGFFCAKLEVPLDYDDIELGKAAVPLVKYPAQQNSSFGDYQGMILLNPGGPGASGTQQALDYGATLQAAVGSNFDVIGFDPRGIYYSEPVADCWANSTTKDSARHSQMDDNRSADSIPRMPDSYYNSWIDFGKNLGQDCQQQAGGDLNAGKHMSTAITARDMLSIVDAFAATPDGQAASKPNHLLNYYGISYGTFLGQTFASMFPDRVGHVVLDGVVSPEGYLSNYTWSSVTHLDGVISAFFIHCQEVGPSNCSFHTGSTPQDIHIRFEQSFVQLDAHTAAANGWSNATDLESALLLLKIALLTTANHPLENFALLPEVLTGLEDTLRQGNISLWTEKAMELYGDPTVNGAVDVQYNAGVLCSDMENRWSGKTLEDMRPLLVDLNEQSIVGDIWIKSMLPCLGWSIRAAETFQGPFGGDTATPILFVGNTYDPVTPFDNALTSAPNYKDAQVLVVDGMGHTILPTGNMCALSKVAAYFQTGTLPATDDSVAVCEFEPVSPLGLTVNGTLEQTIAQHGLSDLVG